MRIEKFKYFRTLLYLVALLVFFMTVADVLLALRQRSMLIEEAHAHTEQELTLMGTFLREALLKGDYASAEQFMVGWGKENADISALKATAPNGFALADYRRKDSAKKPFETGLSVVYGGRKLVDLEIVKDLSYLDKGLAGTVLTNILFSVVFALVFGALLWFIFRKTALQPMENMVEEINLSNETLEQRVRERTADLVSANEELEKEIAERRLAEHRLAYSEKYLRSIIEAEPECVKVLDKDGAVLEMNPAGLAMLEVDSPEQAIGKPLADFIPPEHREAVARLHKDILSGRKGTLSFEIIGLKGSRRWMETHAVPFSDPYNEKAAALAITRDITESRKLEEHLRHAQKMEALGTLTGGIAHEFNNILTAIMGYGELLDEAMHKDSPLKEYVRMIRTSSERAAKLTKGLLAYSRRQIVHLSALDMNDVLDEVGALLSGVISEDIELRLLPSASPLTVLADKSQIEQVIMNLATNAVDAMPGGGALTISLSSISLDADFVKHHGFGRPGAYALLSVTDTGAGMDKATLEKIFEPFFTTKEVGKGTGLGLSMVYGIIKRHNGYVNAYSEPSKGTSVKVYLPLTEAETKESPAAPFERVSGGTETILLAEDDPEVRALVKTVLERAGYMVIDATDGQDAVIKFAENQDKIRLLLMDVVMPRMTGLEAYKKISLMRPGIRPVFISGYPAGTRHGITGTEELAYRFPFVSKPIVQAELLRTVRENLRPDGNEEQEPTLF